MHFKRRGIAVPFAGGPFPINAPNTQTGHVPDFGDGFFYVLPGTIKRGPDKEKFNRPCGETLTLTNLVAQMRLLGCHKVRFANRPRTMCWVDPGETPACSDFCDRSN